MEIFLKLCLTNFSGDSKMQKRHIWHKWGEPFYKSFLLYRLQYMFVDISSLAFPWQIKWVCFLLHTIESILIINSLRKKYGLEPYNLSMKRETVYFKIFHRDFLRHLRSKKGNLKVLKKVLVAVDVYIWWPIFICSSL